MSTTLSKTPQGAVDEDSADAKIVHPAGYAPTTDAQSLTHSPSHSTEQSSSHKANCSSFSQQKSIITRINVESSLRRHNPLRYPILS